MKPRCPYFGSCGGCQHQDVDYAKQVASKQESLRKLFHRDVPVRQNPDVYNYRNRMDFIVTSDKLGLKAQGDYSTIIDIDRCEIQNEALNEILSVVREWIQDNDISGARPGKFEGFLRFVMLRGDEHHQQLTLTTTSTDNEDLVEDLVKRLGISSVVWTIEDQSTERSVGSDTYRVYGEEAIPLQLAGKEFLIDSRTFFQTSPKTAQLAVERMREFVDAKTVYDLYCGVGILGQCLAEQVIGVDNNASNIEQARKNAQHNDINAQYHCADAAAWLRNQQPEIVIVDPPRTGLQTGVHTLLAAKPRRIIYLSCNPKTQARDLVTLKRSYDITHIEGFDFFAHTDHVECLVVLTRK